MLTLEQMEALARTVSTARESLAGTCDAMQEELRAIERKYLPRIKRAIHAVGEAQAALLAAVQDNRESFVRPRSRQAHGVKFGWRKQSGKLTWSDPDYVVARIERLLPELVETLVKVTKTPRKAALQDLDAGTIKKLGCTITDSQDAAFVELADTEVDKLVRALLKEAVDESIEEVRA